MRAAAIWSLLTLVFVDEVLAAVAVGLWGHHRAGWWLAVVAPVAVLATWWAFASPKAPYGGPVVRPLVKAVVFGLASLALLDAGHPGWAVSFLAFSVVVNALAQLPVVRRTLEEATASGR